jgi:GT2 family glycosyltransferase
VVQADSDVLLGGRDLEELVAALLEDERNGAAFAWPVEARPQTAADRASAALCGASAQNFLALYALSSLLGGVPSLAGALCVFRREALKRSGGLEGLGGILGEDDAVARRLVRAGYRVAASPSPARCTDGGRRLREVVERAGRWMTVVRAQRPALLLAYPLTVAATPLHLALSLALRDPTYLAMAGGLLLLRALLAAVLLRRQGAPARGALLDVLRAELLMWAGLLRALATRRVRWRGRSYRVLRGGVLQPDR